MDTSTRAPGYDLFKLIVAILLLMIALILMWASPPQSPAPISTPLAVTGTIPAQPTVSSTPPVSPAPTRTALPIASPTATNESEPTATPTAGTDVAEPTPTLLPTPTDTPSVRSTSTPLPGQPVVTTCDAAASRSRLDVSARATILRRLNFRSSPGIRDNWVRTNMPGTQVEVVGGPECIPYWTGAYVWWQIRLPDGRVGWSAEGSLHGSFYFMEPAKESGMSQTPR